MSHGYDLVLEVFADEITRKGLLPKLKHLTDERIKEIALKGLEDASRGELTHLSDCPQCKTKWHKLFKGNHLPQKPEHKHSAYAAK